jgi:hypothetical protein
MLLQAASLFAFLAQTVLGTNIVLTNDDEWAVALIRAQYDALQVQRKDIHLSAVTTSHNDSRWSCPHPQSTSLAPDPQPPHQRLSRLPASLTLARLLEILAWAARSFRIIENFTEDFVR